ncbi:hypothetical protein [Paenirhodobacter sp. CAU 1674]|uniref:hypothetical protein n=1 Tax=Paenirhodobacter sp. CAU 1674 TaxID=3032596 RepID=UPI0023DAFA68|nr:hypothetical protein [Paenirhodobacter sp. CAU 1674]MDF2143226.1 hypothetical protein [Paenirhodobacter sp. CAU 1674]
MDDLENGAPDAPMSTRLAKGCTIDDIARGIRVIAACGPGSVSMTIGQPHALEIARLIERRNEVRQPSQPTMPSERSIWPEVVLKVFLLVWLNIPVAVLWWSL